MLNTLAPIAKAITGAIIAGLGALGTALTDGGVSAAEWVAVATATLTASLAVWAVPNADPAGQHQAESVQPPDLDHGEHGAADVPDLAVTLALALLVAALVVAFL